MNRFYCLIPAFFCFDYCSGQVDKLDFGMKGGIINGRTIENLNTEEFEFNFSYEDEGADTIRVNINHKNGIIPFSQQRIVFTNRQGTEKLSMSRIKPGDSLMFVFQVEKVQIVKSFFVSSITEKTYAKLKPYYVDVYFIYNKDTLDSKAFPVISKYQTQREGKVNRLIDIDPYIEIKNVTLEFNGQRKTFEINRYELPFYHGKITIGWIDNKKLLKRELYSKAVGIYNFDTGGGGSYQKQF